MKKICSILISMIMALSVLQMGVFAAESNDKTLSYDAAAAYKSVIDDAIAKYGEFKYNKEHFIETGVGLIRLIDFDGDGTLELLIGVLEIYEDFSGNCFYEVYGYDNGSYLITHTFCNNSMDLAFSLGFAKCENRIYAVTSSDTICDRSVYYGTLVDGKWITTEYYAYSTDWDDGSICPELYGTDVYKLNGNLISEEEYQSQFEKYENYDDDPYSEYVRFGEKGVLRTMETISSIINGNTINTIENQNDKIKEAYIKKLQDVQAEAKNNYETPKYSIYDINKDSIPELFIKRGTCEADYRYDVFSYIKDEVLYIGQLPGGHISLCGIDENGILLYFAHMGYEIIFEGKMNDNAITYDKIYEEDCSNKEYAYEVFIDNFRSGAFFLDTMDDLSNYSLVNEYFNLSLTNNDSITVILNGKKIEFDQQPIIVDNRTLVPLRAIFEALGATVDWNGTTQTVTSTKDSTTISMTIGQAEMYKNGEVKKLDVAAQIVNNRTLVPVRAIAESFNINVDWNGDTNMVILNEY